MQMQMAEQVRVIQLGAATVTVISVGDIQANLAELLNKAEHVPPPGYAESFGQPLRMPIQCILIQLPAICVLVDASVYDISPDSPFAIPGYQPPPGLLTRLAERGVKPEAITHVVITHSHFDHISGVTKKRDGHYEPCFPNARYYLGRPDWENPDMQTALQHTHSLANHTLGILHDKGLLELVTGTYSLSSEVQIMAASGETAGHQIVRVCSEGQTLYCVGDLYHHPIEIEHPEWMVHWANAAANQSSRRTLTGSTLVENALVVATHISTIGRLEATASGIIWKS